MNWMKTFSLLVVSFLVFACSDDPTPDVTTLHGKWEIREYQSGWDIDWVETYHFEPNGSFQHSLIAKEPGSDVELGYTTYRYGNFHIQNQALQLTDLVLFISLSDIQEGWYSPKEELVKTDFGVNTQSINFTLQNNNTELVLEECPTFECEEITYKVFLRVQ
ncbi:hypothetical protein KI659_06025 [Litoribacter alkaliphilus]|uniref:Lipocalin-like domain-containing protein n=1 Tax=Litoribacter ruber TaxID=702568 RepID=A0AAP2CHX1_9BACT|nr:hypothetical protein [Litoribacter alkaliphilus]MBS9523571.1 hypothetical protein [Litoribacter alkaliphilus]